MKDKIILTDADGVLVNWGDGFNQFMTGRGLPQLPDTENTYNLAERHNISAKEVQIHIKEFNEGQYIENLTAFADSVEYVEKFADLGFRFIVVTSISSAPSAKYYRTRNLINLFGDVFDEIHCIEQGASKAFILSENWLGSGYYWIEDHMRQAEAGHEAGLKTVLIKHPYNEHYETDLFPMVSFETPWKEIYEMVCKDYGLDNDKIGEDNT